MKRKGFTLVELLVVITIIAILATISLQVIGATVTAARDAKTKTILWRLRVQMEHKAQALQRLQLRSAAYTDDTWEMLLLNRTPAYAGLSLDVKRRLVHKLQLGHFFPQDKSEMWDALLYPPGLSPEEALTRIQLFDYHPDDDLKMIDGWGNPIAFYRWPTNLFKAHPELLPGAYARDPDDPLCQLSGLFTTGIPFDPNISIIMPEACKPYVMVFVSAGPDGRLGLSGPLGDVTSEDDLADNIWSMNVR